MLKNKKMYILVFILIVSVYSIYRLLDNFGKAPTAAEEMQFEKLSYYKNGYFQGPVTMSRKVVKKGYEATENFSFSRIIGKSKNAPKKQIPMVKPVFTEKPSDFAVYWLGHSSTIIELDGKRILIDPVFGNSSPIPFTVMRYSKPVIKRKELPRVDYIIITHNHYDHLERDTIKSIKSGIFIVPLGVATALKGWGVAPDRIVELGWDDSYNIDTITLTAVKGNHFSGRSLKDANKTLWNSYVIKSKNKNIFWSGDTGYGEQFKEHARKYGSFDLVAVEIDAWNENWANIHMFPYEVAWVCEELKAKRLLPIHWGVFDLAMHKWNESIELLLQEMKSVDGTMVLTPKIGERIDDVNLPTDVWWRD